ncbi:phosphatase PAP2 family protein [Streptomyces sp. NPDC058534]|uniref:phosphatase PAP2 family protein n=1 Tax=Streptomyces sp. NPDC058534 TaxID=3346541 RepID=UPI003659E02E
MNARSEPAEAEPPQAGPGTSARPPLVRELLLVTGGLYLRRPAHYVWARRVPAAGMVDTARVYGPSVYGPPATDELSNQFAAMPSLHFGWALMVAVGLVVATRSRLRWLWLLHPLLTLLVIVGTANHYWPDVVAATALLGLALAVLRPPHRPRCSLPLRRPQPRRRSAAGHELVGAVR